MAGKMQDNAELKNHVQVTVLIGKSQEQTL
jgi:hypothetical protein